MNITQLINLPADLIMPTVCAITGWLTNFVAVKMLFRPYKKVFFIQGMIPANRKKLAGIIGNTVGTQLLSGEVLARSITKDENIKKINNYIDTKIDDFFNEASHTDDSLGDFLNKNFSISEAKIN